ncbi:hypothetical protein HUG20_11120 [Salicibibacter cibi]|uniref:ATPase BadF/BadG/BcrA/BcrD type domain-containing protein n=1 Tax=Salicibibacter cibi TaxID=2743001 RepID=A0A7T7CFQ0_9BACI|nr:BadF/BadG/BcrA/BcrD ATPase family protein [Salicibibacter cibi]QQK80387.1 hypothetical protein HUG20_11120 [Salicibibacter cibi]
MEGFSIFVLGIDGGGTKTTGVLCADNGKIFAQDTVGATNPNSIDYDIIRNEFQSLFAALKRQNKIAFDNLDAVFIGMAGVGREEMKLNIRKMVSPFFSTNTKVYIDHDAINALYSGTLGEPGVVNIAGTGSITFGINEHSERGSVGGWGYLLGDPGSGFAIGREAVQAVFHAYDGSGPLTQLTDVILQYFDRNSPPELLGHIYEVGKPQEVIAPISKIVIEAADREDDVAKNIISNAGSETAHAIQTLSKRLLLQERNQNVRVSLTGGVYQRSDWLLPAIQKGFHENVRDAHSFTIPEVPPVTGALVAALKELGIEVDPSFLEYVKAGCAESDS